MKSKIIFFSFSVLFLLGACKTGQGVVKEGKGTSAKSEKEKLIIGTWELVSLNLKGEDMPAELVAGAISLSFDGTNITSIENNGEPQKEGYKIEGDMLLSAEKPEEDPIKIEYIDKEKMTLKMEQGEDVMLMGFKRVE